MQNRMPIYVHGLKEDCDAPQHEHYEKGITVNNKILISVPFVFA